MATTSIDKIKLFAGTQEVELPGWEDGEPFVCKLRRPTLYAMMAEGGIPNPLLPVVAELFSGNPARIAQLPTGEMVQGVMKIAKMALVEPSAKSLEAAGVYLTDLQVNEIYAFVIGGAAGLDRFRAGIRRAIGGDDGKPQGDAEPIAAH